MEFKNWFLNLFPEQILSNPIVATIIKVFAIKLDSKYKQVKKETNYDV